MLKPSPEAIEQHLLNEISRIESKIIELESEKKILERMLVKARRENTHLHDVTRKNSVTRIIIENSITTFLKSSGSKGVSSKVLFELTKNIDRNIKETTFRSYLNRMKKRNIITNPYGRRGVWVLASSD